MRPFFGQHKVKCVPEVVESGIRRGSGATGKPPAAAAARNIAFEHYMKPKLCTRELNLVRAASFRSAQGEVHIRRGSGAIGKPPKTERAANLRIAHSAERTARPHRSAAPHSCFLGRNTRGHRLLCEQSAPLLFLLVQEDNFSRRALWCSHKTKQRTSILMSSVYFVRALSSLRTERDSVSRSAGALPAFFRACRGRKFDPRQGQARPWTGATRSAIFCSDFLRLNEN